jgi:hypothetical protein
MARLGEPTSVWMLASHGKLESQRDALNNTVMSKKSVADLVSLEKSGKRDAMVVRRQRGHFLVKKIDFSISRSLLGTQRTSRWLRLLLFLLLLFVLFLLMPFRHVV